VAIAVLVNVDANNASTEIARRIASELFTATGESRGAVDQAKGVFAALQRGEVDRSLFTANMNAYFTLQALRDFADSLGPLGTPSSFTQSGQGLRGGMVLRRFAITAGGRNLSVTAFYMPDGKIEQFLIAPAD